MKRPDDLHATNEPERQPRWRRARAERVASENPDVPSQSASADPRPSTKHPTLPGVVPLRRKSRTEPAGEESSDVPSAWQARRAVRRSVRERKRFERGEVRRFTERARRARRRVFATLGILLAFVGVVAATVTSPVLRVREVVVVGTSRVDAGAVQTALDPELGSLIAFVDHDEVASHLSQFSLIQSISVQSRLPSTLVVTVTERTPVGVSAVANGFTAFDAAGVTIETTPTQPADLPLFSVRAVSADDVGFRSAVEVLNSLPASIRSQVTGISGTTRDDVAVTLNTGLVIIWGDSSRSDYKAVVLKAVLTAAPTAKKVDLSAPDVPVVE